MPTKNRKGLGKLLPVPDGYVYCGFSDEIPQYLKPFKGLVFYDGALNHGPSEWSEEGYWNANPYADNLSRYAAPKESPLALWVVAHSKGKDAHAAALELIRVLGMQRGRNPVSEEFDDVLEVIQKASQEIRREMESISKRVERKAAKLVKYTNRIRNKADVEKARSSTNKIESRKTRPHY